MTFLKCASILDGVRKIFAIMKRVRMQVLRRETVEVTKSCVLATGYF